VKRLIPLRLAARTMLAALAALAVFHLLLMTGAVPATVAWGGRADASQEAFVMIELAALAVLAVFALVTAGRAGWLPARGRTGTFRAGAGFMTVYFALNTLGNLAAVSQLEKAVFTPLTVVLTVLSLRLALGDD